MASFVYFGCLLTSTFCAVMLAKGYLRTRVPLLFWSTL